ADQPPQRPQPRPVEALHLPGQFRRRLVADADAHHRDAQATSLAGDGERETAAAGQETDRLTCHATPRSRRRLVVPDTELLLDAAHVAAQLRQLQQAHEDAHLLVLRHGRRAQVALTAGHVAHHPRLGPKHGPVPDLDVIRDADLAGHHDIVAGRAGAGDADLADEQVVPADPAVVADHHQVVDFRPLANARRLEGAAVNGRASADLHIVADL